MFGVFGADFFQGTRDKAKEMMGQRQQVALAFQEFKKNNPTATYGEFQSFVDNMTDGSNYLRGALPAQQVLQELGKQNEINRRQQAMAQQTAALVAGQERDTALRNVLAQLRAQGVRDPYKAVDAAAQQLGVDRQQDPAGYLALEEQIMGLGPDSLWKRMDQQEFLEATELLNKSIQAGLYSSEDALKDVLPESLRGTQYEQQFLNNGTSQFRDWRAEQKAKIVSAAVDQVLSLGENVSPDKVIDIVGTIHKERFGGQADLGWVRDIASDVWNRAEQARQQQEADNVFTLRARAMDMILSNPGIAASIKLDPDNGRQIIRDTLNQVFIGPNKMNDAEMSVAVDGMFRQIAASLDMASEQSFNEAQANIGERTENVRTENYKMVDEVLGKNPPQNVAQAVAIIRSRGDGIDTAALTVAMENEDLEGKSALEVVAYLESMGATRRIDEEAQAILEGARPQSYEDYLAGLTQDITQGLAKLSEDFDAAIRGNRGERMTNLENFNANVAANLEQLDAQEAHIRSGQFTWARLTSGVSKSEFQQRALREINRARTRLRGMQIQANAAATQARNDPGVVRQQPAAQPAPRRTQGRRDGRRGFGGSRGNGGAAPAPTPAPAPRNISNGWSMTPELPQPRTTTTQPVPWWERKPGE